MPPPESRRERRRAARAAAAGPERPPAAPTAPPEPPVPRAELLLVLLFLLPNLGALLCGFVLDDVPLVVDNPKLHSLGRLGEVWTSGYWPDREGLTLYRPLSQTLWAVLWGVGGGRPLPFHAAGLLLGALVVVLAYRLLLRLGTGSRTAFVAAALFAAFPIHTEATTSVVGSAEVLAAALALLALHLHLGGRRAAAIAVFALAVLSKESAAAVAGVAAFLHLARGRERPRRLALDGAAASLVVVGALLARGAVARGPQFVPAIDNPTALLDPFRRVLSALWVQVLYVQKTLVPVVLSADYSYKEVPLVMGLADVRAWAGLLLVAASVWGFVRRPEARFGIVLWAVPFLPAANLLFPIGTLMGERLAYLPSLGLALLLAPHASRWARWREALAAVLVVFAVRTAVRNLDWRSPDVFYPRLVETSAHSAKSWYFLGALRAARGDDGSAVAAYDVATGIFPAYAEAFHNRGNALVRLGRREEAKESYRQVLRFDPGHGGAASNLAALEAGRPLAPPRRKL